MVNIAVFVSGGGTNLQSLIDACRFIDTVTQKEKDRVLVDGKINIDLFLELDGFIQKEILSPSRRVFSIS